LEEKDISADGSARTVQFLAATSLSWQIWKETEPELFWVLERMFQAWRCVVRFTGDQKVHLLEVELPLLEAGRLEKAVKDGSFALEVDKIHGLDPILHRVFNFDSRGKKMSNSQSSKLPLLQPAP
jgi:hypothetical protein